MRVIPSYKIFIFIFCSIFVILLFYLLYSLGKVKFKPAPVTTTNEYVRHLHIYRHVSVLAEKIGSRSVYEYEKLCQTRDYITKELELMGYKVELQTFYYNELPFSNIIATIPGTVFRDETVIFGTHYDTVYGTPGADDNASGVAVLLEICRLLKGFSPKRTLNFVFFALEEPPVFRSEHMGSFIYAKSLKERGENVIAMICLEMVGYFRDDKGGQSFPLPFMSYFYPSEPNFIAVVGNLKSRLLVETVSNLLEERKTLPVATLSTLSIIPGVDFSDHRSFWKFGYPACMITDTAFYRNPYYHTPGDRIETLDFFRMEVLLHNLVHLVKRLSESFR
ncbi:MAG: M28 family peptidase [Syntrophales bacterium]|nr:M28 family peptidase [Syntrophales bacterium]